MTSPPAYGYGWNRNPTTDLSLKKLYHIIYIEITYFTYKKSSQNIDSNIFSCYYQTVAASYIGTEGRYITWTTFLFLFVAVAAGVACHYIIKWLDGDK